jgi:DNA-directed RNA polymerase specialized sigma24 family protein
MTALASWNAYTDAKRQLSPRDRAAVTGRIEDGLSYEELKEILEVQSCNTVRVAVTRAITRLVKIVARQPSALQDGLNQDQTRRRRRVAARCA